MAAGIAKKNREGGNNVLLALACVVVIVTGLKLSAEICVPIAMGLFLGVLSLPVLNFLNKKCKLPRPLAILVTVLIVFLLLGGMGFVVSGVIPEFQERGPEYAERLKTQAAEYSESIDKQLEKFNSWGPFFGIDPEINDRKVPTFKDLFNRYWDTKRIVALIDQSALVGRFTSLASKSFFVLILMIFVLAESQRFADKVRDVIRERGPDLRRFQNSSRDIQNYLLLKTTVSLLTGLLAWMTCALMNVEFPLLWGLVAFVLNFIPVIGSILAALPPVALALILQGFWPAVIVLVAYLAINIIIGNVLEPKLLGDSFGISTIVVILSVLIWGYIWGPAGMFLAVPLTMMVKVMLDNTPDLRWISVMISSGGDDFDQEPRPVIKKVRVPLDAPVDTDLN
ncbi:MAG: AI-2E family transporter [Verrucomicrobiales bacterium]|nr:AI-2E family transporter [Verrucomicrobiales bacterium]